MVVWYHKGHVFERWFGLRNGKVKIVFFGGLIPTVLYLSNTTISRIVNFSSTKPGLEGQSTFELFWVHFPLFRPRRIQWKWNTWKCIEAIFYKWKWNLVRFYSKKSHNYRKLKFTIVKIILFWLFFNQTLLSRKICSSRAGWTGGYILAWLYFWQTSLGSSSKRNWMCPNIKNLAGK